jgi:hypothetical protein
MQQLLLLRQPERPSSCNSSGVGGISGMLLYLLLNDAVHIGSDMDQS